MRMSTQCLDACYQRSRALPRPSQPLLQVPSPESAAHAEVLRAEALAGSNAMAIVTSLTTEVGPRLAGSEAEARARMWALDILNEKGFSNVRNEPFEISSLGATRGKCWCGAVSTASGSHGLGRLGRDGRKWLERGSRIIRDLRGFKARARGSLSGRIAYVGHAMQRTQDGSSTWVFQ